MVTTPSAQAQAGCEGYGCGTVFKLDKFSETVLYNFQGSPDGGSPLISGVVMDPSGTMYGTTEIGGTTGCGGFGCGTVYKLDSSGTETVLYSFTGGTDGSNPYAGVVRDAAGNLYGTTAAGGAYNFGTVFKVDTNANETVLHSFAGGTDGGDPEAGLLLDETGTLYGTTPSTVFKVDTSGNETVLHTFTGGAGGKGAFYATLLMDKKHNLYGVTDTGGQGCPGYPGCGVVYRVSASGKFKVLYSFNGYADGCVPYGTLIMDKHSNIYGTTEDCGAYGYGTVFKLSKSGTLTTLHGFAGGSFDGAYPEAGVIRDKKGNLYGTTFIGGGNGLDYCTYGCGTVYKLSTTGKLTLLHGFAGTDGYFPFDGLMMDASGDIFGTTWHGGKSDRDNGAVPQITK